MAEWSKAVDLRPTIVRCEGSNPSSRKPLNQQTQQQQQQQQQPHKNNDPYSNSPISSRFVYVTKSKEDNVVHTQNN